MPAQLVRGVSRYITRRQRVNAENGHDQHAPIISKMLNTVPDAYMRGLSHN